jgi:hypothetical protein
VIGFFAGTFTNKIGVRFALSFGGIGYSVYVASFLSYSHNQNHGFTTFAGALLGVCAGLLWTAQGESFAELQISPRDQFITLELCRHHHDELPARGIQGQVHQLVLDDLQPRCCHWKLGKKSEVLVQEIGLSFYLYSALRSRLAKTSMSGRTKRFPMAPTSASWF